MNTYLSHLAEYSQAILDSALDSIIVIGEDGRVLEFNPAAERMFGYTRAQAMDQELATLIIPEALREPHRKGLAHYLATGEGPVLGRRIEVPALRADGSQLTVELAISPFRVDGHAYFTAYLRDITVRKADEEARQRLLAIMESSDDAIIGKDLNGVIYSWNAGARHIFGYEAEEVIGKSVLMLIPPDRQDEEPRILARLRNGERIENYETVRQRKDGSVFNISLTVSPIRDSEGKVVGASKIGRDITERKQTERRRMAQYAIARLTAGEAPLEEIAPRILETIAGSARWVVGTLWLVNTEGALVCHSVWTKDSLRGSRFTQDSLGRTFQRGEGLPGRVLQKCEPHWIRDLAEEKNLPRGAAAAADDLHGAFVFPLTSPEGVNGVIEIFSHEPVQPDDDLVRLVSSLGIQVGLYIQRKQIEVELRRQKEAAEAANQAKDRFLAALSHELRTPLNPVLMWACATIEDERLDADFREGLRMVCRNIELEARLIDDLLDLTRISRGKLQLHLQPCQADRLVQHALDIVQSQMKGKKIKVAVDLSASSHEIVADPTRIQQVFWNLLKNAAKFTDEDGRIEVRSYDAGKGRLAIEVRDTGRGLEPEIIPRLFVAFEQGGRSGEGLGLGLAICKAILDMHGATIVASNLPEHGACFRVEFETVQNAAHDAVHDGKSAATQSRKLRILIVEDHEHTAAVMNRLLKRSGHEVLMAATVRAAIEILQNTQIDLLVSDLGLPDGNGFQVMRELAKISNAKGIAVSGYGMEEDLRRSTMAGFSAHLTKPINVQELQETIQFVTSGR